jgi:uncharacterized membrane protein
MGAPDASIGVRIAVAAPLGAAAAMVMGFTTGWPYAPATGWIVGAVVYLTWTWLIVGRLDPDATRAHATKYRDDDSTPWILDVGLLVASIASLAGVGYLLVAGSTGGDVGAGRLGTLSVVAAGSPCTPSTC